MAPNLLHTLGAPAGTMPLQPSTVSADRMLAKAIKRVYTSPWSPKSPSQALGAAFVRESLDALQESCFIFEAVRDDQGAVVDLRYQFMNAAGERLYGRPAAEVLGHGLLELFPSVGRLGIFACYVEALRTGRPSSMRVLDFDGLDGQYSFDVAAVRFGDGVVVTARDVTGEVSAQRALAESQALVAVAVEGSRDGTVTYGRDLRFEYVNRRVVELSGIPAEGWIGRSMEEMGYPPASVAYWTAHIQSVFESGQPRMMQYDVDNTEGHRWFEASLSPQFGADGAVAHVISTNRDITERVVAEASLRELATRDPLTGLANRPVLLDDLDRGIKAARRSGRSMAILLIDLDRFRNVNDAGGHQVGDAVLRRTAQRLVGSVRGGDLVGRMGGDEFVVVMRNLADPAEAVRAAWRLVEALRRPFSIAGGELFATASIGIAVSTADSTAGDLLRDADTAMYAAKEAGRDRVAVFNDELRDAIAARLAIEGDLRHALEQSQLAVWYQPEVDLGTGRIIAAEALLRWHHPSGETLTAARFVDVAEETGLILDIGYWVLIEACTHAATWAAAHQDRPITVRVNVSARQLAEDGLLPALDEALSTSRLDPGRLCLEITETALLRETPIALANIAGIHDRGVRLAIDDFGTGYASLTYLHRYPIDVIKIDRSFIAGLTNENRDYLLVGALITMARHLDLSITAEGVETEEQAATLRTLGCPSAQGYLYSPAIPPEQMTAMLGTVFPQSLTT